MPASATQTAARLFSNHEEFIQRMTAKRFRLSRILKILHNRRKNIISASEREANAEEALEDERRECKRICMQDDSDLEWDEDKVYPSNSDSSITESSEGEEALAAETVKKESRSAEGTDAVQADAQKAHVQALHDNVVRVYARELSSWTRTKIASGCVLAPDAVAAQVAQPEATWTSAESSPRAAGGSKLALEPAFHSDPSTAQPTAKYPLPSLSPIKSSGNDDANAYSDHVAGGELDRVSSSDRQLAKTISHMMKKLYRNVGGKTESVFTSLLLSAAEEDHCDVNLRKWFQSRGPPRTSAENDNAAAVPNVIVVQDDDRVSYSSRDLRSRGASSKRSGGSVQGAAKDVGWPDTDLRKYPFPKNPKNWPAEEEFSSSVLLNQGTDCVSKAAAMEYRVRNPLEHVEIRVIDDATNPCNGARGLFAKTKIPKGRLICTYIGLYRQQTDSFSHYIFNLDLEIPSSGKAAAKKVFLDVDSRASCIGNESKFINDGICLDCIKAIQTENSDDELKPRSKRQRPPSCRWISSTCANCRPSNVEAKSRLNALLAGRAINKGEELLLNYGEDYWRNMMPEEVNAEGKKALADLHTPPLPSNAPPTKKHNSNGSTAAKPELPTAVAGTVPRLNLSLHDCPPALPEN